MELSFSTGVMFNITQIKSTFSFIFIIASNHYIGDLITLVNYSVYKSYKEKKEQAANQSQDDDSQKSSAAIEQPLEQLDFNVYSAFAIHALGENETIIEEIQNFKSPELDEQLLNSYGLPLLSYRIKDLAETNDEDIQYAASPRQVRIMSLIRQQLEQNIENLYRLAEHLKRSILFYESHQIREYHMHPAWVDPNSEYEDVETPVVEVHRLNRLNLHIFLPEDLLHVWNDEQSNDLILEFLLRLVLFPKSSYRISLLGERVAYQEFIHLLKRIQKKEHEVFLMLAVDSEIDQDLIDEKSWMVKDYIPAEFAASCLLADPSLKSKNSNRLKLKIVVGQEKAAKVLHTLNLNELPQYEGDEPYVLILSDQTDIKQRSNYSSSLHKHLLNHITIFM